MSKPAFREARWDEATEYSEDKSVLLGPDGWSCYLGEPEDRTWGRDGHGAVAMLNKQHAEITRLTAELTEMSARAREADAACTILGATNGETLIRAAQRVTVEARMVAVELAAARAVPPDVDTAITGLKEAACDFGIAQQRVLQADADGPGERASAATGMRSAVEVLKSAISRAISDATAASQPATVGGLLATAPVGAIVEWQDENDAWMRCVVGQRIASMWWEYPPKWTRPCYGIDLECIRFPARLVPAHLADADPASRGPIGEG